MNNLLVIFIVLSIVNVIFSTIKSIVTVKGGAFSASILSALYYGYYNIVLIYNIKAISVSMSNFLYYTVQRL